MKRSRSTRSEEAAPGEAAPSVALLAPAPPPTAPTLSTLPPLPPPVPPPPSPFPPCWPASVDAVDPSAAAAGVNVLKQVGHHLVRGYSRETSISNQLRAKPRLFTPSSSVTTIFSGGI